MSAFDYKQSTITKYRSGKKDDPYISIGEPKMVNGQIIQLSEIPVRQNGVTISGLVEVQAIPKTGLPPTGFYVDYNEGLISFHPSQEGLTLNLNYMGRGNHYISSARVWTKSDTNGNVQQTLQNLTDEIESMLGLTVKNGTLTKDVNGNATGFQETNDEGTLTNTSWTFNVDGTLNTVTEVIGTQTVTTTMNYVNGEFVSVSKS